MYDGGLGFLSLLGIIFALWPVWLIIFLVWLGKRSDKKYYQQRSAAPTAASAAWRAPVVAQQPSADMLDRSQLITHLEHQLAEAKRTPDQHWKVGGLEEALKSVRSFGVPPVQWDLPPVGQPAAALASTAAPAAAKTDSALTLLYLGAFLFVGAIALFVWLAGLDGVSKTFLILLTAGLFYGAGLKFNSMARNLHTAAPTFLAIGVGTLPFAGWAMNRYLYFDAGWTWILISLIALGMSIYAVNTARAQVIGYFTAFAWLSLLVSSLTIVDAPLYMFMWAVIVASIILRVYAERSTNLPGDDRVPFENTVQTAVPTAILGSFITGGTTIELWQVAVTVALSASYYLLLVRYASEPVRSTYASVAHLLGLAAAVLAVIDVAESKVAAIGLTLSLVAAVQLMVVMSPLFERLSDTDYRKFLYGATAVLPLTACLFFLQERDWLISSLVTTALINVGLLRRSYRHAAALPLVVASLVLPYAVGWYQLETTMRPVLMLGLFLCVAVGLWLPRHFNPNPKLHTVWRVGYIAALGLGLLWMMTVGTPLEQSWAYLLYAVIAAGVSAYERHPYTVIAVPLLLTITAERALTVASAGNADVTVNLALACFGVGALGYLSRYIMGGLDSERRKALTFTSIAVLFMAWPFSWGSVSLHELFGPTALLLASVAVYLEAQRDGQKSLGAELLAIAGMLLAVQLGMHRVSDGAVNDLVYTHLWAAYFAFAYWRVKRHGDAQNATLLKYLALLAFTLPTAFKALDDTTGNYGLLLLGEHVVLAIIGEYFKKRLFVRWGVWVSILTMVYTLRSSTFLNIGFIALVLITYSVYRISKSSADNR